MAFPLIPIALGAGALGALYLYTQKAEAFPVTTAPAPQGPSSAPLTPAFAGPGQATQPFWTVGVQQGFPRPPNQGDKPRYFADWAKAASWELGQAIAQGQQNGWSQQYPAEVIALRQRGPLATPTTPDQIQDPVVFYDAAAKAYSAGLTYIAAEFLSYANALIFARQQNEGGLLQWPPRPRS